MRKAFESEAAMFAASRRRGRSSIHRSEHLDVWAPGCGVCITGGCKNSNKNMVPHWDWTKDEDFPTLTEGPTLTKGTAGVPIDVTLKPCAKGVKCGMCKQCTKCVPAAVNMRVLSARTRHPLLLSLLCVVERRCTRVTFSAV